MNPHRVRARAAAALVLCAAAALATASSAAARPDDAHLATYVPRPAWALPLERIGDQFVRGDDLTGAGAPAPAFVPEQG